MADQALTLTPEQEAQLDPWRERWLKIGLCCDPADRPATEEGVRLAYEAAGFTAPPVKWVNSPYALPLAAAMDQCGIPGEPTLDVPITDAMRPIGQEAFGGLCWGQQDAAWIARIEFFRQVCGVSGLDGIVGMSQIAQNAGWWLPYDEVCYVAERPTELHLDERHRLHNDRGPAIAYPDGWALWSYHGVEVPSQAILAPASLDPKAILKESNAEVRASLCELYGWEKLLVQLKAKKEQADDFGALWRIGGDLPLKLVELDNSTPEPDGSRRKYFLAVPADVTTAHEAVARSFGMTVEEYNPLVQT